MLYKNINWYYFFFFLQGSGNDIDHYGDCYDPSELLSWLKTLIVAFNNIELEECEGGGEGGGGIGRKESNNNINNDNADDNNSRKESNKKNSFFMQNSDDANSSSSSSSSSISQILDPVKSKGWILRLNIIWYNIFKNVI